MDNQFRPTEEQARTIRAYRDGVESERKRWQTEAWRMMDRADCGGPGAYTCCGPFALATLLRNMAHDATSETS